MTREPIAARSINVRSRTMSRVLPIIVLYTSSLVLTIGLCIVAYGIHAVGRGFGSMKSSTPLVIAATIVWLLHAGYLLGPWLYQTQRHTTALWLMIPIALAGIAIAVLIAKQLIPGNTEAMNGKFVLCCVLWTLAVIVGYIAPIVVMLTRRPMPQ